jgi:hypothetical protein
MVYGMVLTIVLLSCLVWEDFFNSFCEYWPDESKREHAMLALAVPMACVGCGLTLWALIEVLP